MINENNILFEFDMNASILKIKKFLEKKYIFCKQSWIKEKIESYKNASNIEEKIYKEVLMSDMKSFIDHEKFKSHCDIKENFRFDIKHSNINNLHLFLQISGYCNIAEPIENSDKNSENLDVLDNFESKFLQSETEEDKKITKIIFKFQFSDGIQTVYGFEYENLKDFRNKLNSLPVDMKFPKVLIGPIFEVRRGIIYLKNNNISLL